MAELQLPPEGSGFAAPPVGPGAGGGTVAVKGARDGRFAKSLVYVGGAILVVAALAAIFAPLLSKWGPTEIDPSGTLAHPGGAHLLGTDGNGMDVWSRVVHAARIDLGIAVCAVALAVVVGTVLGLLAGYLGGWIDDVLMRVVDIFQAFPTFILALAVAALLGDGFGNLVITIALVNAPAYARLVRAEVRTLREMPYIDAAKTSGTSTAGILWRHLLPNSLTPVRVIAPLNCGWAMLTLAGLSFLGLGVTVPTAEWGSMISLGTSDVVAGRWWTSVPPGLALLVCVLGFSLLGEGLQERADARRR